MRLLPPLFLLLLPVLVDAVELRNELSGEHRSETLTVEIDGRVVGTLRVDDKHPSAVLDVPLGAEQHRYRLSGEAVKNDGTRIAIAGGGLIVRTAVMDRIGEATSAAQAFTAFEAVVADLHAATPEFPSDRLRVVRGAVASEADLAAAEGRLGRALPVGYRDFVRKHGSLRIGSATPPTAAVLAPGEVQTLEEFVLTKALENDNEPEHVAEMRKFIGKRFPEARRDLVLDVWQDEYPSVVRASARCPAGKLAFAFPESQWEVLMASSMDDNPFVALISYEDDIVGETNCMRFEQELAFALHDHLYEAADDVLYLLGDDEDHIRIERGGDFGNTEQRVWFRFGEIND